MKPCGICACLVLLNAVMAQQPAGKPAFEVASIKPSDPNPSNPLWIGMNADPRIVRYTNITLKDCIRAAWRVRDFEIEGPAWIGHDRFQIDARLPEGASPDQIPDMLQSLLVDRFKLTLRHGTREQSVYALLVGKNGPVLKPAEKQAGNSSFTAVGPDGRPRPAMMFHFTPSGVNARAPSASVASFVELLSRFTSRPVVDMTGLKGVYDFDLTFAPETTQGLGNNFGNRDATQQAAEPAPSLADAVRQYGLKLEARKLPIEILSITHAERTPTEN